jgi:uncharacterized membrane protein
MSSLRSVFGRRAEQAGIMVAGANVPLTFQRTLMPRNSVDQAIVTGLSISTNRALVTLVQESIQSGALWLSRGKRGAQRVNPTKTAVALDLAAVAAGIAVQRAAKQHEDEPLLRAAERTAGFWLSVSGAAGAMVGGLDEALDLTERGRRRSIPVLLGATAALAGAGEWWRIRRSREDANLPPQDAQIQTARALALGLGVSVATSGMAAFERRAAARLARVLARVLPGEETLWQPVGHAVALGGFVMAGRFASQRAFAKIEHQQGAVETAFDIAPPSPMLSGSHESHVQFATLSLQGRRFVWMVTPEDVIANVVDAPAVAQPIRVYVGLESAPTEAERVELALQELERTGAFDRSWLMVVSPTGTGYVNYAAVSALEFLARGDCATTAMQYAARPSVLSLSRVSEGRAHMKLLLDGIRDRLNARGGKRPKIVVFGESLGAWTSQDPFVDGGTQGLDDAGIDYAIWIGTPHFSKWKNQVLAGEPKNVDASAFGVFNDIEEFRAVDADARKQLRFVMITHHDDGVALFGPELTLQAPTWLGDPSTRPSSVPRGMRWVPTTTFFQVLTDMKNSANVVPGVFAAKGHDYRADLLPFFDAVLGFNETPERLAAIGSWLEARERMRSEWVKAHGDAGRSLSVSILERLFERERAAGRDPDSELLQVIREVIAADLAAT